MINLAIVAALEAGKRIMEVYANTVEVEMKQDNSPLTKADKLAHQTIVRHLSPTNIPILSEEGKAIEYAHRRQWPRFWLVDPLDGTKEFIKKNGEFTVNIALVDGHLPVMGVVYAPAIGSLYWGEADKGAFKVENIAPDESVESILERKTAIQPIKDAIPYKIVGSRSHSSPETDEFVEQIKKEKGEIAFVSMGSSLKLCLIAEGNAQIYPRLAPTMEWDTAAAHAIAKAAGCSVVDAKTNQELVYNKENLLNPWFVVKS